MSDGPDVSISRGNFEVLLPFHVLLDTKGVIQSAGLPLTKLLGAKTLIGRHVDSVLKVVKPRNIDLSGGARDGFGKRLTVAFSALGERADARAFGMTIAVTVVGEPHVLLALTPGVNARNFIENHGLKISDLGPSDGSADILPLLAMQEEMLEDSKRKSASLAAARDVAERLANHDALTGLPNRRALMRELKRAMDKGTVNVLHMDLDRFKEINDTFGHAAGDAALKHAAACLREVMGDDVLTARLGGDEFIAALEGTRPDAELRALARRLVATMTETFEFGGEALAVGASVGIATKTQDDVLSAEALLHHADLALYKAKRLGNHEPVICSPELRRAQEDFQNLSADIRRGLVEREFQAHFQPQVDARTGTVLGAEALVRWNHPRRGLLAPSEFLDAAARAGLIRQIDASMRRSALDALALGDSQGIAVPKINLNVTIGDLTDPEFCDLLFWELDIRGIEASRLGLEIVEAVFFDEDSKEIEQACNTLVSEGFTLSLDDFGTGHASALSLVNLPLSMVKIDRAFAAGVANDARRQAMARSLVSMATTLELEVLAEGVDDEADVAALQEMGCHCFQSFHFCRPMPREAAFKWMSARLADPNTLDHATPDQEDNGLRMA